MTSDCVWLNYDYINSALLFRKGKSFKTNCITIVILLKKNAFILRKLEVLTGDRVFLVRVQVFLVRVRVQSESSRSPGFSSASPDPVRVQVFLVRVQAQSESSTSPGFAVCRIHFHCEQTIQFLIFTYYTVNTVLIFQYSMYTLFCCPNLCLILIN